SASRIQPRLQNGQMGAKNFLGRRLRAYRRRPWRNPRRLRHAGLQRSYLGAQVIISTIYLIAGELSTADTTAIKGQVYRVLGVGAISFEVLISQDTSMILKHKLYESIDRTYLETALAKSGNFQLL